VANIKSQIKRNKTNEKARLRNKAVKSSLKTAIRKAREAAAAGDVEKATEYQRVAARQLDKAVSKGVIHKNQAANKKSALARKVAAVKSSLKTAIRKAREAAAAGDAEKATEYQRAAARQLDKAVSKGVIHKNQAANKKSALARKVASVKG
jgi:small subunit ribosomal protein S20